MKMIRMEVAVGLLATGLVSGIAVAQQTEEVTVQASRIVEKHVGQSSSGVPIVDVSITYGVSYADLDLISHAGVMELEKRVNDAAQRACKELDRQARLSMPSDADCAKAAVGKAMVKVNEVVAAASNASGK